VSHPNPSIDYSQFPSIAGMTAPPPTNTYPYAENYFLSFQRELNSNTVLNLSYVGSEAPPVGCLFSKPGKPGSLPLIATLWTGRRESRHPVRELFQSADRLHPPRDRVRVRQ